MKYGKNNHMFKHGHAGKIDSREYRAYVEMKRRCLDKTRKEYFRYGGRGIKICKRWLGQKGFQNFILDMGKCPTKFTLERVDNAKGYDKNNCIWASLKTQARNRCNTVLLTRNGITKCMLDWCQQEKISQTTVNERLKRGWSVEEALTKAVRQGNYKKQKENNEQR